MADKIPCPMCGNKDWIMMVIQMIPGKGTMEVCEQCDPANRITPVPDYICPYNDIYCMFEIRDGRRSMCSCWGGGLDLVWYNKELGHYSEDKELYSAFCQPNWPLIESLVESNNPTDRNRIMNILMSEKQMRKLFVMSERVTDRYKLKIIRTNPNEM